MRERDFPNAGTVSLHHSTGTDSLDIRGVGALAGEPYQQPGEDDRAHGTRPWGWSGDRDFALGGPGTGRGRQADPTILTISAPT